MSVSILVVDDETDFAELFRQHFRREARQAPMSCISPPRERRRSLRWRWGPSRADRHPFGHQYAWHGWADASG